MADRGMMQPALSMWLANIVLIIIAIPALLKTTRETPLFHRPLITTRETISESKSDS